MIKAIIFDYDGVICDTETNTIPQKVSYLKKHGIFVEEAWMKQFVGQTFSSVIRKYFPDHDHLDDLIKNYYVEKEANKPPYEEIFFQDVLVLLNYCKTHGLATAIASNSGHSRLVREAENLKLLSYINKLISSDCCGLSKPDPAFYQFVLDQMHVKADEAIIIEDSTHGIAAAKGAGVFTIARKAQEAFIDQSQADMIVTDYHQVIDYLQSFK